VSAQALSGVALAYDVSPYPYDDRSLLWSRVSTSLCVTNGSHEYCHCSTFEFGSCTFREIAGGTGTKIVCESGEPDPLCRGLPLPTTWTCDYSSYGQGLYCDCGCGAPDPDCEGLGGDVCERCLGSGSCNTTQGQTMFGCIGGDIDPERNWTCIDGQ